MTGPWIVAFAALWIVVVLLTLVVLGVLRRVIPILAQAEEALSRATEAGRHGGLRAGAQVPPFSVQTLSGATLNETDLRGSPSAVLFLGHTCKACEWLVADLNVGRIPQLGALLVVVSDDARQAQAFRSAGDIAIVAEDGGALARAFESDRTPQAFVVGEDGRIRGSGTPNDWQDLQDLLSQHVKGGDELTQIEAAAGVAS